MHVGGGHRNRQWKSKTIDGKVPLATFDTLAAVITALTAHLTGLDALAVDHHDARQTRTSGGLAHHEIEGALNLLPNADLPPFIKVAVDRAPRREIVRQLPPLTAGFE